MAGGRWSSRRRGALAIIIAVVALQLVVPALALRHERPAAFGWQMFAAERPLPIVELIDRNGKATTVARREIRAAFANYRPEIRYEDALARHLCRRSTARPVRVVLRDHATGNVEVSQRC